MIVINVFGTIFFIKGKARRLKQAKDEATEEIEKYRQERDKQFKDFEAKVFVVITIVVQLTNRDIQLFFLVFV